MDRNKGQEAYNENVIKSLSARRAWIEIQILYLVDESRVVALRKESVDRNIRNRLDYKTLSKSLSARRAWIEMLILQA